MNGALRGSDFEPLQAVRAGQGAAVGTLRSDRALGGEALTYSTDLRGSRLRFPLGFSRKSRNAELLGIYKDFTRILSGN